ncbi:Vacuolar protein sorting-associated protein atg6 [Mucor velutinosus]|uniref:Vacuolar protein sorting-associated protein atg6 n=1 Tax=Mucor velutinosus TaxID=708070 RepID=A0AAN7I4Z9_9FUNG|nr:Vacuolar protein sorting-associated protein atg6 [Mucor velutinosus]
MSDLATQKPNRSVRRQLTSEQSKRERKEKKRLMKNSPNFVRFNSKKYRKIVPYNPIKAALVEKDNATPKKKDSLSEMFVPAAVVTDKAPATMVIAAAVKIPEEVSEVNTSQEDERKELSEEENKKEEKFTQQHQEPLLPELSSSTPLPQEEALKEISHESVTNEEEHNVSSFRASHDIVSIKDKTEPASINQSDARESYQDETENEAISTPVNAPSADEDSVNKYDKAELTTTDDETDVADTNKEIKEETQQIQQRQELKKKEEEEEEEKTILQKDATPAPSMTTSASISDKISPSTSTSSSKHKSTLISRLFKHKNGSKKDVNVALTSNKDASYEKKKKFKAWKIWKKL